MFTKIIIAAVAVPFATFAINTVIDMPPLPTATKDMVRRVASTYTKPHSKGFVVQENAFGYTGRTLVRNPD